jgi:hypothetical protein
LASDTSSAQKVRGEEREKEKFSYTTIRCPEYRTVAVGDHLRTLSIDEDKVDLYHLGKNSRHHHHLSHSSPYCFSWFDIYISNVSKR